MKVNEIINLSVLEIIQKTSNDSKIKKKTS